VEQEGKRRKGSVGVLSLLGKYKYVLLVLLAGVVCMMWPSSKADKAGEENHSIETTVPDELAEMQEEMEAILGKIHGVGQLKLMLTLDRGKEAVLAEDSSLSYSGNTLSPEDYSRTSEPVVLSGSDEEVIVRQEVYPRFRGALVVCEGGGDAAVQLSVIEAVSALTGLGADKISVVKWQS